MASAFDPANSQLGWNGFADGNSIGTPGAPPIDNTANPYSAMAAEMVGEIAMNAGAEYMAPTGEWNEELGKYVYTKKPFGSVFGKYTIPEDAIWSTDVGMFTKKKEIADKKFQEANQTRLNEFNSMFEPNANSLLQRPLTETQAIKTDGYVPAVNPTSSDEALTSANEYALNSNRSLMFSENYRTTIAEKYSDNEFLIRNEKDNPDKTSIGNASQNLFESKSKHSAFSYVKSSLGNTIPEFLLNAREEEKADMHDEVSYWMTNPSTIGGALGGSLLPFYGEVSSPGWNFFNENPELWQEFKANPIEWYFRNKGKYGLSPERGVLDIFKDDYWSAQNDAKRYANLR